MARATPEWVGKTPDAKVPPRVKLRIWWRYDGKCWLTGRKIQPGDLFDFDHIIALINGGEHREYNLAPALRDKHREKTAEDVKLKAKGDRAAMRAIGIKPARSKIQSAGFPKPAPQHTATTKSAKWSLL